ncbi:MAG: HD-GYP domain-containing protein [Bacillota bacterium]
MFAMKHVHSLLHVLADREPEVAAHCHRVMVHALALGSELQLDEEEMKVLGVSALLHDTGKLLIPPAILHKEEKLTAEEWEWIKEHAQFGEAIVLAAGLDPQVAAVIRHHHERWDGKGYPDGLAGSKTPLLARLLAVADAYDAMTTARPYQEARSAPDALAELQRCRETHFDPGMVDCFVKLHTERYTYRCTSPRVPFPRFG